MKAEEIEYENPIPRVERPSVIERVYNCIASQNGISKREIANRLGLSTVSVSKYVDSLIAENRITMLEEMQVAGASTRRKVVLYTVII